MRVAKGVILIDKNNIIWLITLDGLKKMTGVVHDGDLVTIQIKPARKEEECLTTLTS